MLKIIWRPNLSVSVAWSNYMLIGALGSLHQTECHDASKQIAMSQHVSQSHSFDVPKGPQIGEVIELLPGVKWLRLPVPFPPGHINLWLLQDGDGWTLVDCGIDTKEVALLWRDIAERYLDGKPLKRIIVTHHHADHLGMAAILCEKHGAELLMTSGEYSTARRIHFQSEQAHRIENKQFWEHHGVLTQCGNDFTSTASVIAGVPRVPSNIHNIADSETIKVGAYQWRAIESGGHTTAHLSLYCEELNLLIAGDQILPGNSSHIGVWPDDPQADPIGDYLSSLNDFGTLPKRTLVMPSHGEPFNGLHHRLAELKKYYYGRLRKVFQLCDEPRSAAELIPSLFSKNLNAIQYQFALAEVVGCLNNLQIAKWVDSIVSTHDQVKFVQRNSNSLSG